MSTWPFKVMKKKLSDIITYNKEEGLNVNYEMKCVSENFTSHQLLILPFLSSCYVRSNKD